MLQKLETVLEDSKNYRLEECMIDSIIRIDDKDLGNLDNYCENCVFREKLEKIVFCPIRCRYIEGPRVLL